MFQRNEPVMFRFWNGDVIALFPDSLVNGRDVVMSYQHIGQHGSASFSHIMRHSRPATQEEYGDLKAELESIGYELTVYARRPRSRQ